MYVILLLIISSSIPLFDFMTPNPNLILRILLLSRFYHHPPFSQGGINVLECASIGDHLPHAGRQIFRRPLLQQCLLCQIRR